MELTRHLRNDACKPISRGLYCSRTQNALHCPVRGPVLVLTFAFFAVGFDLARFGKKRDGERWPVSTHRRDSDRKFPLRAEQTEARPITPVPSSLSLVNPQAAPRKADRGRQGVCMPVPNNDGHAAAKRAVQYQKKRSIEGKHKDRAVGTMSRWVTF